jgi:hypothetical protein
MIATFVSRWLSVFLFFATACADPGAAKQSQSQSPVPCSDEWQQLVEQKVPTGDGQGHGPDIGSDEWKSVVEFKLGIRDKADVPDRDSEDWCRHIDQWLHNGG